ncbi:guanylate kinase [Lacibacterium aquatile]|uniref:Guanylate kinase n=1 Tax=Lacibacterium aquatile TaxID=1168082 RepID=A0ABW5DVR3_9PROT
MTAHTDLTLPDLSLAAKRRGLMLILSSPSGTGKTTLSRMLRADDSQVTLSISVTTRDRRPAEEHGRDYHFIGKSDFDELVAGDRLLEYAEVYGNHYGTPRDPVEKALTQGLDVLFDIDWQGTQQMLRRARPDLVTIFILPPSMQELERRLRGRAQDPEEVIARRMAKAHDDVSHWNKYDYTLVNSDLDETYMRVRAILMAERLRRDRQIGMAEFVSNLQSE